MNLTRGSLTTDGETLAYEVCVKSKNAVILHGAGQSSRKRYYTVAEELEKRDIGVLMFDFSGCGESSGQVSELSLERRAKQARAIIDRLLPQNSELYLIGFSMSGQTVCDLLPIYSDRIKAILLACPAMYSEVVHKLAFGNELFTATIRVPESWRRSSAPSNLAEFNGKTIIAIGNDDEVIPRGVVDYLKASAKDIIYHEYPGVKHALASWFSGNPKELSQVIDELIQ